MRGYDLTCGRAGLYAKHIQVSLISYYSGANTTRRHKTRQWHTAPGHLNLDVSVVQVEGRVDSEEVAVVSILSKCGQCGLGR